MSPNPGNKEFETMDLTVQCAPDETIRSTVVSRKGTFLALTLHGKPEARVFHLYSHDDNPFERLNLPVTGKISGMAFPPEQREIALAIEQHHCVERYALGLGRLKCLPMSSPQSVTYNRDGCLLAAGSSSGRIVVWSFHNESPAELYQVNCGDGCIIQIDFGIGNQQLFALTADNRCFQVDFESSTTRFGIATNASTKRILTEDDGIASDWQCLSMAAHPWLPIVVFGGNDRFFWTYDYKLKTLWRSESETANYVRKLQFLPEAKKLAVFGDQTLEFWHLDGVVFRDRGSVGNRTELLGRGTWRPTQMVKASTAPAPGLIPIAAIPMETKAVVAWAPSGRA